jgi:hypothetical protein
MLVNQLVAILQLWANTFDPQLSSQPTSLIFSLSTKWVAKSFFLKTNNPQESRGDRNQPAANVCGTGATVGALPEIGSSCAAVAITSRRVESVASNRVSQLTRHN